jgi:hypothetical protein
MILIVIPFLVVRLDTLFSPLKLRVATGNWALKILLRDVDFERIKVVDFF